jgi:predicted RecB family nuclease
VGPVFVYHKTYEEIRLKELSARHPDHAPGIQRVIDRLVDLLPLVRESYYHPCMRGSFSIKKVLPTIATDLNYSDLGGVSDGTAAQADYLYATFDSATTPERKERYRQDLLRYCKLDTWAMVEVAYHLQRLGRPEGTARERLAPIG